MPRSSFIKFQVVRATPLPPPQKIKIKMGTQWVPEYIRVPTRKLVLYCTAALLYTSSRNSTIIYCISFVTFQTHHLSLSSPRDPHLEC